LRSLRKIFAPLRFFYRKGAKDNRKGRKIRLFSALQSEQTLFLPYSNKKTTSVADNESINHKPHYLILCV